MFVNIYIYIIEFPQYIYNLILSLIFYNFFKFFTFLVLVVFIDFIQSYSFTYKKLFPTITTTTTTTITV